ncbi:MAG: DUF6394 family protein [Rhodocyclaceae bacterium]
MNLEKVIFGFFIILTSTLNFGFCIGTIDEVSHHHPTELFATLVVSLITLVLKFGDRTHLGATHLATSLAGVLQITAACMVWAWHVSIQGQVMDGQTMSIIVSLASGALLANGISVILLIGETLRQSR